MTSWDTLGKRKKWRKVDFVGEFSSLKLFLDSKTEKVENYFGRARMNRFGVFTV